MMLGDVRAANTLDRLAKRLAGAAERSTIATTSRPDRSAHIDAEGRPAVTGQTFTRRAGLTPP